MTRATVPVLVSLIYFTLKRGGCENVLVTTIPVGTLCRNGIRYFTRNAKSIITFRVLRAEVIPNGYLDCFAESGSIPWLRLRIRGESTGAILYLFRVFF